MEVVTGAMGSLLPKLGELLMGEYNLQKDVKKDVGFLEREMKSMQAALSKVGEVPWDQLDQQVKIWSDEVRELSYDMEDVVDNFLVRVEDSDPGANSNKIKQLMEEMSKLFTKGKARHEIANAIKEIKAHAQQVAARRDRYRVDDVVANTTSINNTIDPRLLALYKDQKELVGIEGARGELIKRLTDGDGDVPNQPLKIVSIFGPGGLGKTTLAKAVYDRLQGKFDRCAFVSVGRNHEVKKVLKDILFELRGKKPKGDVSTLDERELVDQATLDERGLIDQATLDERQLIDQLQERLENARYFIVIDDIWDLQAWKFITCALLDNGRGSRVITTTRILNIARETGDVYEHKPLSDDFSEELFHRRLFGGKDKCPYDKPAEISNKILQKCRGVPLTIIAIASLLASKPVEDWSKVYSSIGFGSGDNNIEVDNMRQILSFSYYDLPCHLRSCLLHLSIFLEDSLIMKDKLIWKWVAEGLVREEPKVDLFETGERYFNELINRSMIQPVEDPHNYLIYACRVHDMILDMLCLFSKEQNFVTILNSHEQIHTSSERHARRFVVQKRAIDQHTPLANMSTLKLRSFYATMCNISIVSPLSSFQVLRVLVMEGCTFMQDSRYYLKCLGRLVQLRYLGLENTPVHELPEEGDLRFLLILDLRGTKIEELPKSVGLLGKLKRLRADLGCKIRAPNWIGNLTSLEELCLDHTGDPSIFVKELGKMTNLKLLCIWIKGFDMNSKKTLVESLGNLHKIKVLRLLGGGWSSGDEAYWEGYVPSGQLRYLSISAAFHRLPPWINSSLLPNLTNLYMTVNSVEEKDVQTFARFPELLTVRLVMPKPGLQAPPVMMPAGYFGAGMFPKLRTYFMEAPFKFKQGAMAKLECFAFQIQVRDMRNANFDFDFSELGNLPCLQDVRVGIVCNYALASDVEAAEAAVRQAVGIHPNRPSLFVHKFGEREVIYNEAAWNYALTDHTRGFCPSLFLEHQYAWNLCATRAKQSQEAARSAATMAITRADTSANDEEEESDSNAEQLQADQQRGFNTAQSLEDESAWNLLAARNKQSRLTITSAGIRLMDDDESKTAGASDSVPADQQPDDQREAKDGTAEATVVERPITLDVESNSPVPHLTGNGETTGTPAPVPARRTWRQWVCFPCLDCGGSSSAPPTSN